MMSNHDIGPVEDRHIFVGETPEEKEKAKRELQKILIGLRKRDKKYCDNCEKTSYHHFIEKEIERLKKLVKEAFKKGYKSGFYREYGSTDINRAWVLSGIQQALKEK